MDLDLWRVPAFHRLGPSSYFCLYSYGSGPDSGTPAKWDFPEIGTEKRGARFFGFLTAYTKDESFLITLAAAPSKVKNVIVVPSVEKRPRLKGG